MRSATTRFLGVVAAVALACSAAQEAFSEPRVENDPQPFLIHVKTSLGVATEVIGREAFPRRSRRSRHPGDVASVSTRSKRLASRSGKATAFTVGQRYVSAEQLERLFRSSPFTFQN